MTSAGRRGTPQRCRTLVTAAALGVILVFVSIVGRGWVAVAVGVVGTAVILEVWRRECWSPGEDGTDSRDS